MNEKVLASDVEEAYTELAKAQKSLYWHTEKAIQAKDKMEKKLLRGLADGTIAGKNQALRDAAAANVLEQEFKALDIAEADSRAARLDLDLARTEISRVQALIRLAELMQ
jgi:hypothetical protein